MELPKKCVFDGTTDNLNTSMTVKLEDGREVTAWISDTHADDATPKAVREAAAKMVAEQDDVEKAKQDLIAQAKAMGLTLVPEGQQVPPQADAKPKFKVQDAATESQGNNPEVNLVPEGDNRVLDSKAVDSKGVDIKIDNQGGAYGAGARSSYVIRSETKASEDLREGEKAEIGTIKGRAGIPTAIPIRRKGKMGETTIKVIDTGGDAALQNRFKNLNNDRGDKGYTQRECSMCRGNGTVMGGKKACPKCGGSGLIG